MSVVETVKSKSVELRKSRDPLAAVLGSVLNIAQLSAKDRALKAKTDIEVQDADIIAALRKTIKQSDDMLAVAPEGSTQATQAQVEKDLLVTLLPAATPVEDIKTEIVSLMSGETDFSMKQMGRIMAHLNSKFGSALDKATASREIKVYLTVMTTDLD